MTYGFRLTLIWIVGCLLAFVLALNFLPAALVDGHYIPVSNDSFYHARRILDAVANPGGFYEFDRLIHYPEGSWIAWPWGYDWLMAQIVRADLAVFGPRDPIAVLDYIPVFSLTITISLVLAITGLLRLTLPMRTLVVLCFAVSPLTQSLHGVGMIDHHYVEHIFILLSIWLTMLWLRAPGPSWWPMALGIALGAAITMHNGLFILQLPILLAIAVSWLRGLPIDPRSALRFALALTVSTLLAALPAHAFRAGEFEFYLLSWFHVYVAACTSVVVVLLSRFPYSTRRLLWLAGLAALLLVPIGAQAVLGGAFLSGQMEVLQGIDEVSSPVKIAFSDNAGRISRLYGLFGWLAPVLLLVALYRAFRERRPEMAYFWIISACTLVLLMLQLRFYYYGSIALYAIPFLLLERLRAARPQFGKLVMAASAVLLVAALVPPIQVHLFNRASPALDPEYANTRVVYPQLANACRKRHGVALASTDQGHYVRYHTSCAVIANNFRLTPQHLEKVKRVDHLYRLDAGQLLVEAPEVTYVVATLSGFYSQMPDGTLEPSSPEVLRKANSPLDAQLLLSEPGSLPPRYKLLFEAQLDRKSKLPLVRLFEIEPAPATAAVD